MQKTLPGPGPARPGPEEDDADADRGTSFWNSPGRVRQHAQGPRYTVRGNPSLRQYALSWDGPYLTWSGGEWLSWPDRSKIP